MQLADMKATGYGTSLNVIGTCGINAHLGFQALVFLG